MARRIVASRGVLSELRASLTQGLQLSATPSRRGDHQHCTSGPQTQKLMLQPPLTHYVIEHQCVARGCRGERFTDGSFSALVCHPVVYILKVQTRGQRLERPYSGFV